MTQDEPNLTKSDPPLTVLEPLEISVWMSVFGCVRELTDVYNLYHHRVPGETISESDYYRRCNATLLALAQAADITHSFSVILPSSIEPRFEKRLKESKKVFLNVKFSPAFWRWYNWWDDYLKSKTAQEMRMIHSLVRKRSALLNHYRPEGDWLGYRANPAFALSF